MIISNFSVERDWSVLIDALATEFMSGMVQLPIETRDGEELCTRTGTQLTAFKRISFSELGGKPKINGFTLDNNVAGESLGLASVGSVNALLARIISLEAEVSEIKKTNYLVSRDPE